MNFQLAICGLSHVQVQLQDIWPTLPVDDLLGYVLSRVRTTAGREGPDALALEQLVSQTCVLFTDDGTVRRLLCGPPPGLKSQQQVNGSNAELAFRTCGEAFDLLDDGTRVGLRGWLYFAYQSQTLECHCKYRDDIGGYKAHANGLEKHRHVDIRGVDLLFGDVLDIKKALVARGAFSAVEEIALLLDKSSPACHGTLAASEMYPTASSAILELPNDELLFPILRDTGAASTLVVQREGITVTVLVGSKRLMLPRFPVVHSTVHDVLQRLRHSFQVTSHILYLEALETDGALQPSELLSNLVGLDGEVHLSTALPPPPPAPFVNEGSRTITITAQSAHSPQRSRTNAPTLMSAAATPLHATTASRAAQQQSHHASAGRHRPPTVLPRGGGGVAAFRSPNQSLDADEIAGAMDALHHNSRAVPGYMVVSEPPKITCRVDVSDCCSINAQHSVGASPLVDVVLPDDGLPFTGRDLKQFLVSNHIISSLFASPADLRLVHGKRDVMDYEDLHAFVAMGRSGGAQQLQVATILITCRRNR